MNLDVDQILQFLMEILTAPSDAPAGDHATVIPPPGRRTPPGELSEEDQMKAMMHQLLQQIQMQQQSGQQSMNAVQGGLGGMFGGMGGRPPGS